MYVYYSISCTITFHPTLSVDWTFNKRTYTYIQQKLAVHHNRQVYTYIHTASINIDIPALSNQCNSRMASLAQDMYVSPPFSNQTGAHTYIHTYHTHLHTYIHTYIIGSVWEYKCLYVLNEHECSSNLWMINKFPTTYIYTYIYTYIHTCLHTYVHNKHNARTYIHT